MTTVLCPGLHGPELTQRFRQAIPAREFSQPLLQYPGSPLSPRQLRIFLAQSVDPAQPLTLVAFSAGTVGAIAAAHHWHYRYQTVAALLALDGWGVPLAAPFPIYRLSHDYFTHWSSALLGAGDHSFYADPPVRHLDLWRSPDHVWGYCHRRHEGVNQDNRLLSNDSTTLTAAEFIQQCVIQ
ncbi:MAG: hypothetical protein AAF651_14580 [Cyanobacteria bacterium P01_C01_bin.73]